MPRRNAGPTPPTPPAALKHSRTYNPNAYESSADIVARRNAQNALQNTVRGSDNRANYMADAISSPRPQMAMPQMPRQGMFGLTPSAPNQIQTPFHYYPSFNQGGSSDIDAIMGELADREFNRSRMSDMAPMIPMDPRNRMDSVPFGGEWSAPQPPTRGIDPSMGMGGIKKGARKGMGAMGVLGGMAGLGMSLADMTPEEINQMYLYLSQGGAFGGENYPGP